MDRERRTSSIHVIRVICFLAAACPNCTRCCPTGSGCESYWAWQDCPPSSGCGGCGSCDSTAASPGSALDLAPEAGDLAAPAVPLALDAAVDAGPVDERGGTLAFVGTQTGTFLVVSLEAEDEVRVIRVDANALDDDPLTVRPVGRVALDGEGPSRVVDDAHGRALLALRAGGAVAAVDPLAVSVSDRRAVCKEPNGLTVDAAGDAHVACGSGEIVTLHGGAEARRVAVDASLDDVAAFGGSLLATGEGRLFVLDADAGAPLASDAEDAVGALRVTPSGILAAMGPTLGRFEAGRFRADVTLPGDVSDVATAGGALALVSDGDAYLRASPDEAPVRIGGGLLARAVAMRDVAGENVVRRVLAVQTVSPRMVVFFTVPGAPAAAAIEPLE